MVILAGGEEEAAAGGEIDEAVSAGEPYCHATHAHPQTEGHHSQQQVKT